MLVWIALACILGFAGGLLFARMTAGPVPLTEVSDVGRAKLMAFRDQMGRVLEQIGTRPVGPEGQASRLQTLPSFREALASMADGTGSDAEIVAEARRTAEEVGTALDDLKGVDVEGLSVGQPTRIMDEMFVARNDLQFALIQYGEVAKTAQRVARLDPEATRVIAPGLQAWQSQADLILQDGYHAFLAALEAAEVSSKSEASPTGLDVGTPSP
jgi:hypothetical protein